jgi:hypothetical protein
MPGAGELNGNRLEFAGGWIRIRLVISGVRFEFVPLPV